METTRPWPKSDSIHHAPYMNKLWEQVQAFMHIIVISNLMVYDSYCAIKM